MSEYAAWFEKVVGVAPYPWQRRLGEEQEISSRLIRIPTGLGKSAGVVLPWLYHRVKRQDSRWPLRLCFVLPMRVLADQMATDARRWVEHAGLDVPVHLLMGGVEATRWVEDLDRPAILIGTQDMMLSRALNRGYASSRGLWPMEFGALHHDCLWVYDEVQLMGVALATSTQLEAFRRMWSERALRPVHSWWMSATLQPEWLDSIDFQQARREHLEIALQIPEGERVGGIWENEKTFEWATELVADRGLIERILEEHEAGKQSLIVLNTVSAAVRVFTELKKAIAKTKPSTPPSLELAHSRFRPYERERWDFLRRDAEAELPPGGRIIIATQVVEAGVDLSASLLMTELAPYPSLVQRFGRAGRRAGERARVIVFGSLPKDSKGALPYSLEELEASTVALRRLIEDGAGVSIRALEECESRWPRELLYEIYPYRPEQTLRRREFEDLFDTSPDLSGADLDVSRYIRVGADRDARIFFRDIEGNPRTIESVDPPRRDELCPAPAKEIEEWRSRREGVNLYVLDYESGVWVRTDRVIPGMVVLAPSHAGGYDPDIGWAPSSKSKVEVVPGEALSESLLVEASESIESDVLSHAEWKTIAFHGREVEEEISKILSALGLASNDADGLETTLKLAARWHDAGKAHRIFSEAILEERRPDDIPLAKRHDLAKAPSNAWRRPAYPERPGFRHELVSTLALFELLKRAAPEHEAVSGFRWPDEASLDGADDASTHDAASEALSSGDGALGTLAEELKSLTASEFDRVAYLVCSHHGKIRCTWASSPFDQRADEPTLFGVLDGDELPALELAAGDGSYVETPPLRLHLEPAEIGLGERYGRAWNDRVADLLAEMGPFTLAYLEALFRAADWRASKRKTQETRGENSR